MGFNFRKTINLGHGLRINLGKKSASVSVGNKGCAPFCEHHGQTDYNGQHSRHRTFLFSYHGEKDRHGQGKKEQMIGELIDL